MKRNKILCKRENNEIKKKERRKERMKEKKAAIREEK